MQLRNQPDSHRGSFVAFRPMKDDWIMILSTPIDFRVELAKGLLSENGIEFITVNKKDSSIHLGEIELFVMGKDVLMAKFLTKELYD